MARKRGSGSVRKQADIPLRSPGTQEMTMHRYTHAIPVCGGAEQQLETLCRTLTAQNDAIQELLTAIQELLGVLKAQAEGPGQ